MPTQHQIETLWISGNEILYRTTGETYILRRVTLFDEDGDERKQYSEIDDDAARRWLNRNGYADGLPRSAGARLNGDDQLRLQSAIKLTGQTKADFIRQAVADRVARIENAYSAA